MVIGAGAGAEAQGGEISLRLRVTLWPMLSMSAFALFNIRMVIWWPGHRDVPLRPRTLVTFSLEWLALQNQLHVA
ncbi:hypothetical protein MF4836_19485 [Pseudomonas sp. MF4836]|nr:hypothetical protein MF4836_19485 [Pseudomonas sp. MF4836]